MLSVLACSQRFEENRQRFREYVQRKTLQNYKFWIVSRNIHKPHPPYTFVFFPRRLVLVFVLNLFCLFQFSIILQQLFDTYNTMVATGSTDELCRTVLTWFEQKCSLPSLRPGGCGLLSHVHHCQQCFVFSCAEQSKGIECQDFYSL